jgi:hypothetical protein
LCSLENAVKVDKKRIFCNHKQDEIAKVVVDLSSPMTLAETVLNQQYLL